MFDWFMREPEPPADCDICEAEYRAKQQAESYYRMGLKPQRHKHVALAERDPRAWFDRLVELRGRAGDEVPTNETLSTIELDVNLDKQARWKCTKCDMQNPRKYGMCGFCMAQRDTYGQWMDE